MAITFCFVGLVASFAMAWQSDGVHHDDDLTHFLYAKWARQIPGYLVHDWGRPGFTVLYFPAAQIGWVAARWFSGILTILAAWLAYRAAERMYLPYAWLVVPLTLIQPMFFQLSYTTLTETPLAFYAALALRLLVSGRCGGSAVVMSLSLVTRHEAVVWLPIWAFAMWHRRARPWSYLLLVWAPIVHNLLMWDVLGKTPFEVFLNRTHDVQYGRGPIMAIPARALVAYGPGLAALAVLGAVAICRRRGGAVIAAMTAAYVLTHAGLRYLGWYATAGYARLLVPVAPMVGLLCVAAIAALADWSARRWWLRPAGVAAAFVFFWWACEAEKPWWLYPPFLLAFRVVTVGVVLIAAASVWVGLRRPRLTWIRWVFPVLLVSLTGIQTLHLARPWRMTPEQRSIQQVVQWLKDNGYGGRRILASNVWVNLLWPYVLDPGDYDTKRLFEDAPAGTVLIWDKRFSPAFPRNMELADYLNNPHCRLLTKSWPSPGVFCYAFEKR